MKSREYLEKLYNQGKSQSEIGKLIGVNQPQVSRLFSKYDIKSRRVWTKDDIDHLETYYGLRSFESIARATNKTPKGVGIKAKRLGLGDTLNATEFLNASQLAEAINVDKKTIVRWVQNNGLKAMFKKIGLKRSFYRISIDDFWKWSEENKGRIKWDKFESGALGKEPVWVAAERKNYAYKPKRQATKWTTKEDNFLKMYWYSEKKIREISKILNRTEPGIMKRARRLNLKQRHIRIDWKPIEVDTLINMKLLGCFDEEIAEELGRSLESIQWQRKKLIKEGKLEWKYDRSKNGRNSTGKLKKQPLENISVSL